MQTYLKPPIRVNPHQSLCLRRNLGDNRTILCTRSNSFNQSLFNWHERIPRVILNTECKLGVIPAGELRSRRANLAALHPAFDHARV